LVGGPAYNDSPAAVVLKALDVPYIAAHPLEFQTLGQWAASGGGLGPVETTMLIALPEIDGATNPTVFAGRHGCDGCNGCHTAASVDRRRCRAMAPCPERIARWPKRSRVWPACAAASARKRKVGSCCSAFRPMPARWARPPISRCSKACSTPAAMKAEGYDLTPPATVDDLRAPC
jgi:magnesium chelatase subunit H